MDIGRQSSSNERREEGGKECGCVSIASSSLSGSARTFPLRTDEGTARCDRPCDEKGMGFGSLVRLPAHTTFVSPSSDAAWMKRGLGPLHCPLATPNR